MVVPTNRSTPSSVVGPPPASRSAGNIRTTTIGRTTNVRRSSLLLHRIQNGSFRCRLVVPMAAFVATILWILQNAHFSSDTQWVMMTMTMTKSLSDQKHPQSATSAFLRSSKSTLSGGGTQPWNASSFVPQRQWNMESYPIGIPPGKAKNLPSIRAEHETHHDNGNVDELRKHYGGVGEEAHLGGFTEWDSHGVSPNTWRHMIQDLNVHSLIDVGCGRGISTSWFDDHGVDVLCVEGSRDALRKSVLDHPEAQMVEHDFSRGPWWPENTYDAAWSAEFLEHVGVNYHFNYITTFRKAALLFVTSSRWGGWHHVEIHLDDWWILKYETYGFRYSEALTAQVRQWAEDEFYRNVTAPNGQFYNPQHIWNSMKVFVNPIVAAHPDHSHLFLKRTCFSVPRGHCDMDESKKRSKSKSALSPISLSPEMDQKWEERMKQNIRVGGS